MRPLQKILMIIGVLFVASFMLSLLAFFSDDVMEFTESLVPTVVPECGECEHVVGDKCVPYQCCNNSMCNETQVCGPNHACIDLRCASHQAAGNHVCNDVQCLNNYNCNRTEECVNYQCIELNCSEELPYVFNHTCSDVECYSTDDCAENQKCNESVCEEFECGECQYLGNHTCMDYWCCEDSHCGPNGTCVDNECENFGCADYQYEFLRRCTDYECIEDSDCGDGNAETTDKCEKPSTPNSECRHYWIPLNYTNASRFSLHVDQLGIDEKESSGIYLVEAWDDAVKVNISQFGYHYPETFLINRQYDQKTYRMIEGYITKVRNDRIMNITLHSASFSGAKADFTITYLD